MAQTKQYPLLIGGEQVFTKETRPVYNKYDGSLYATISVAGREETDKAVAAAKQAFESTYFDVATRYTVLMRAGELMRERQAELAEILIRETGKTVQDANNEVLWSLDLFNESAEEAKRIHGETVCFPVPWLDTRTCYTRREPIGVVAAITPFNFPLNLAVHKLAPALAAGNAVILKPAEATSIIGYKLCEILIDAGVPKGFVSCLLGQGQYIGDYLTQNPDVGFYSFTGSVPVGKKIKESIGLRRCALELGSNSATIVCKDFDIDKAASACVDAAYSNAGQVCISLQRIYVDRAIFATFVERVAELSKMKVCGDPSDPKTEIGPMISLKDAERAIAWIAEAQHAGATVHCGNRREGSVVWPTVLTGVTRDMKVMQDETFAPIVSIVPFDTMEEAYAMVNDSRYGLNSGILTNDISVAMQAIQKLKTGGVIVGGTCGFRFGNMPYGGIKESGIGREAPKYAIEEMTELKTVVILN